MSWATLFDPKEDAMELLCQYLLTLFALRGVEEGGGADMSPIFVFFYFIKSRRIVGIQHFLNFKSMVSFIR